MYKECEECGQMYDSEDIKDGLCPDCLAGLGPYGQVGDEDDWGYDPEEESTR